MSDKSIREYPLGFEGVLNPNDITLLKTDPAKICFNIRRLVLTSDNPPDAGALFVKALIVNGEQRQVWGDAAIPLQTFLYDTFPIRLDLGDLQISQCAGIEVWNTTDSPVFLRGCFIGPVVE